jgi:hypothetical protein
VLISRGLNIKVRETPISIAMNSGSDKNTKKLGFSSTFFFYE